LRIPVVDGDLNRALKLWERIATENRATPFNATAGTKVPQSRNGYQVCSRTGRTEGGAGAWSMTRDRLKKHREQMRPSLRVLFVIELSLLTLAGALAFWGTHLAG
jgi:hypothetical protein